MSTKAETLPARALGTAVGINAGKSTARAMLDAGYSDRYSRTHAREMETTLREHGLIISRDDAKAVLEMFRTEVMGPNGDDLRRTFRTLAARAQAGDVAAIKIVLEYLVGKPDQRIEEDTRIEVIVRRVDE